MPLSASALASKIQSVNGTLPPIPFELLSYCRGVLAMVRASSVSLPLVNGTTAPGAPLSLGESSGGLITATPGPWIGESGSLGPLAIQEHTAVTTYFSTGLVGFLPGTVTGQCTNTPTSPGPLVAGAATGGRISGLSGIGCSQAVFSAMGGQLFGPDSQRIYSAIMEYLQFTAKVTFSAGTINGTCPPGGGPLALGVGTGGSIS